MIALKIKNITICKTTFDSLGNTELLVIGAFENHWDLANLNKLDTKIIKEAIKLESFKGKRGEKLLVYGSGKIKRILIYGLGKKSQSTHDNLRSEGAKIYSFSNSKKISSLSIFLDSFKLSKDSSYQSILEGFFLGSYSFNDYKAKKEGRANKTKELNIIMHHNTVARARKEVGNIIEKASTLAESVAFARDLGNHPANLCTPQYLADKAISISKRDNLKAIIFDVKDFQKMKLGSFYGVARGAKEPAKFILVEYSGGEKGDAPIGLIGKGLTFDTGGISLKPPLKMDEMKFDMCGGATVLGVMNAVSILQPKINIIFAIGSTENMPGSDAQRPGDIVTAYNGKTIEVLNTDAEGRLVLADVLSYVNKNYKPKCMIDFATLTGAVIVALGHRASGLMGNNSTLIEDIKASSDNTGEKVWELPLWDEYSKDIKSKYADIKNIGSGGAGTITAGAFLKEFVGKTPWCHLDIAGTAWGQKEPAYHPKFGATGVAVRLIYNFLERKIK